MPPPATGEAGVRLGVVLLKSTPQVRRVAGVDHPVFAGDQKVDVEPGNPGHDGAGSVGVDLRDAGSPRKTSFQSSPVVGG